MSLTLPDVDTTELLVTPEELFVASQESLESLDFEDATGEDYGLVAAALREAQDELDRYLDRALLVHVETERLAGSWRHDVRLGGYTAWLSAWPFVEGDATSDVTAGDHGLAPIDDDQRVLVTTLPDTTDALGYVAGYRGRQHSLDGTPDGEGEPTTTALTGLEGLDALATLPPQLPGTLAGVIMDLAYLRLDERKAGTVGGKRTAQKFPSGMVTSTGRRAGAEAEILDRAHAYRRLTV